MSKAHGFKTDEEVRAFLDRLQQDSYPCEYAHISCSDRKGGACMDETLGLFPHIAEEA